MNRFSLTVATLSAFAFAGGPMLVTDACAAAKEERAQAALEAVEQVLRHEIEGNVTDRARLLQTALDQQENHAPARWHSGYVRHGKKWVRFDEIAKSTSDHERLKEYRSLRDSFPKTAKGQLKLANWCRKHRLADQERAHLTAVLELAPDKDHSAILARLHLIPVAGLWLTRDELRKVQAAARQSARALKQWKPKIESIRKGLISGRAKQRAAAVERLLAIENPAAIPAMQLVLDNNEDHALLLVQTLSRKRILDASLALARQAVLSRFKSVRKAATKSLKTRKMEHYVPALLGSLYTPVRSQVEIFTRPECFGIVIYKHQFFREAADHHQRLTLKTTGSPNVVVPDTPLLTAVFLRRQNDLLRASKDLARRREAVAARQNQLTAELNERIYAALTAVSRQKLPSEPQAWWRWWNDYMDIPSTVRKRVVEVTEEETVTAGPLLGGQTSCLAAGTPVWTETGLVAIEGIKVGDRVLAKDPQTGELAYKPVLQTTVREAVHLVKFEVARESFETSGGHLFWVSGEGWTKSRDLKLSTRLHGVNGTTHVRTVQSGGFEPVYNLVVADFHTYFVGESKILSHDVTPAKPTDLVVPGLRNR